MQTRPRGRSLACIVRGERLHCCPLLDRLIDRLAPLAVLAGAVALFVSLFLRYYEVPHGGSTFTGWETFSKADILLAIAAAAGAAGVLAGFATRARWPYLGAAAAGALATALLIYVSDRPPAASLVKQSVASGGGLRLVLAYGAFVGIAGALVQALSAVWAAVLVAPAPVAAVAPPPPAPPPPAP
jgi:hypothetical protein